MASLSRAEVKVLKKISESQLITKMELKNFMKNNGSPESRDLTQVVDSVTKGLMDKKLVTAISPVGSTCYIITQRGARLLQDLSE